MPKEHTPRSSIMVDRTEWVQFNEDRSANNDLKQSAMMRAYQRGWHMLSLEQQHAALRGVSSDTPAVAGEIAGTPQDAISKVQRVSLKLRDALDKLLSDGVLCPSDKRMLRKINRELDVAVDDCGVHFNEPVAA